MSDKRKWSLDLKSTKNDSAPIQRDDNTANRHNITPLSWLDIFELPNDIQNKTAFEQLWNLQPEEKGKIRMFGKWIEIPRKQKSFLRDYEFCGAKNTGEEKLPPALETLLRWVNTLDYGMFNQVFVNWYADGGDYIGQHRDDEPEILKDSAIVSVSFGAARTFRVTNPGVRKWRKDFALSDGVVLVMGGKFQKQLKHGVPPTKRSLERRVNVTFRQFEEHASDQIQRFKKQRGSAHTSDNINKMSK